MRDIKTKVKDDVRIKSWTEKDSNGEEAAYVKAPISSTSEDRDGDQFSPQGLRNMATQLRAGSVPLFTDHGADGDPANRYSVRDIAGAWEDGTIEDETLYATARLSDGSETAQDLKRLLDDDMPVGFSVGFRAIDADGGRQDGFVFHEVDLLEVSAVGIPSVPSATAPTSSRAAPTAVTAKSVGMATKQIAKGQTPDIERLSLLEDAHEHIETLEEYAKPTAKSHTSVGAPTPKSSRQEIREAIGTIKGVLDEDPGQLIKDIDDAPGGRPHNANKARRALQTLTSNITIRKRPVHGHLSADARRIKDALEALEAVFPHDTPQSGPPDWGF